MRLFQHQLNKCGQNITLMDRDVGVTGVDLDESFTNETIVKAIVKTKRGKAIFDGSNTEKEITHEIRIAYIATVTAETWIKFKDRNLDIIDVINCGEKDQILILKCNERGHNSLPVNNA